MNGTTGWADLLSRIFDAGRRESVREELREILMCNDELIKRVSNNLGVYFLFCLFGLAILALFLFQACFSLFYVAKFGRFLYMYQ